MPNIITRRQFVATVGAGVVLATGQTTQAQSGFLSWMGRWNERVDRLLFGSDRLAAELPPTAATPAEAFPSYFISDTMPVVPAGWVLKVGGLVARPTTFSLAQLQQMPRTDMRVRHHCVEGWSAVTNKRWTSPSEGCARPTCLSASVV